MSRNSLSPALTVAPPLQKRLTLYAPWIGYGTLAGVVLGLIVLSVVQAGNLLEYFARSDVPAFYIGAKLVLDGHSGQLYDMSLQHQLHATLIRPYGAVELDPFVHPPWTALLFTPLGLLSFPAAFVVCAVLDVLITVFCLRRLVGSTAQSRAEARILLLVAIGFVPLCIALLLGQLPPLLCWLGLLGAGLALQAGQERRAGAWLLLGLIKPQLIALPVLALFVAGRWRAVQVFVAGSVAVVAVSLLALGNWIPGYLGFLVDYMGADSGVSEYSWKMQNWRGLIYHLLGSDKSGPAEALLIGLSLASLAVVVLLCRPGSAARRPGWDARWAVVVLLGLLVDPHLYVYDVFLALGPGFALWRAAAGTDTRLRVLRGVLAAGPFVGLLVQFWPQSAAIQIGPWYLVLLLLAVGGAWPAWQRSPLPAPAVGVAP